MPVDLNTIWMVLAVLLASYSIVGNDSIQTLGTFLSSNSHRPWWVLWIFAGLIMTGVLFYGYFALGDVSYERLARFPWPEGGITWIYVLPPLVLLILTRLSIPVSTTFLVLTIFTLTLGDMGSMLTKSLLGYAVAAVTGFLVFRFVVKRATEYFARTRNDPIPGYWVVLQWCSTGFLWSQWIIQDIANIFVFFPRDLSVPTFLFGVFALLALQGWLFRQKGGPIQRIVRSKTGVTDVRSATIIDFIYGVILFIFKEMSNIPMSTTWVFLGLLAGREVGLALYLSGTDMKTTLRTVVMDAGKATFGLFMSVALALGLPWLAMKFAGA